MAGHRGALRACAPAHGAQQRLMCAPACRGRGRRKKRRHGAFYIKKSSLSIAVWKKQQKSKAVNIKMCESDGEGEIKKYIVSYQQLIGIKMSSWKCLWLRAVSSTVAAWLSIIIIKKESSILSEILTLPLEKKIKQRRCIAGNHFRVKWKIRVVSSNCGNCSSLGDDVSRRKSKKKNEKVSRIKNRAAALAKGSLNHRNSAAVLNIGLEMAIMRNNNIEGGIMNSHIVLHYNAAHLQRATSAEIAIASICLIILSS